MPRSSRSATRHQAEDHADSPRAISAGGWKQILWRVKDEIATDHISVVSAGIAFYALLSLFPAIAALVSIAGLILDPADVASQLDTVAAMLPAEAAAIIHDQLIKVSSGDETGTGLVAFFGIAIALYGAMKGVLTLMEGLNIAYDEEETRGMVKLYLTALAITIGGVLGTAAGIGLMVLLPSLIALGNLPPALETAVSLLRWPLMAILAMLALAALYRFGPSSAEPKWRWVSVGAVVATVLWLLGTAAFTIYVQNFGSYTETYGTLGGVIVLLTWMWLSAFIVLAGAELNAEIEQQTSEDTTTGAPEPMGQRDAVKADTPPPGHGTPAASSGQKAIGVSGTGRDATDAPTPKSDAIMAIIVLGASLWRLRKMSARN